MTYATSTLSALELLRNLSTDRVKFERKPDRTVHLWLIDVCITVFIDLAKRGKAC
jgi:hypothetical protein